MTEVGIFATRSRFPPRPSHVGASVVELDSVSGSSLKVRGLDAWPGSPVLDIKPDDYWDIVKNPEVSSWFKLLWKERSSPRHYAEVLPWSGSSHSCTHEIMVLRDVRVLLSSYL